MIPSIRTITAALALLIPIHALTPGQVELGKIEGFTSGSTTSHAGDYLTSTFCFCAQPTPIPQHNSEANYLQFEYYNSHLNTTYILNHLCLADQDSDTTCLAPRTGDGVAVKVSVDWQTPLCRSWRQQLDSGIPYRNGPGEKLCYEPHADLDWRLWQLPGPDVLKWNGQKRRLDPRGGQGPVLRGLEESEGRCEGLCDEHAGMPALRGNGRAQCHVVVYEDLDDMCEKCA